VASVKGKIVKEHRPSWYAAATSGPRWQRDLGSDIWPP
jgi:hypothetical protein